MLFNDFTRNHTTEQPNSPARSDGCSFTRESGEAEELYRSTLKKRREPWPKPGRRRTDREVFVMQKDTGFFRVPAKALFRASPDPLWAFPTEQPLELGDGDVWVVLDTLARILIDLLSKGRTPSRKLGFSAMFPPPTPTSSDFQLASASPEPAPLHPNGCTEGAAPGHAEPGDLDESEQPGGAVESGRCEAFLLT